MTAHLCDLWQSLLYDPSNRGKIYNDFINERETLTRHLRPCRCCRNMIKGLQPNGGMIPNFRQMTDQEFAIAIRELWRLAQSSETKP